MRSSICPCKAARSPPHALRRACGGATPASQGPGTLLCLKGAIKGQRTIQAASLLTNFNASKVRLKGARVVFAGLRCRFQCLKGAIKATPGPAPPGGGFPFQCLKGAIKGLYKHYQAWCDDDFNASKVRLKHSTKKGPYAFTHISMPQRCD